MITAVCLFWIAAGFVTRHVTANKPQPTVGIGALVASVCWIAPSIVLVAAYWP